MNINNLKINGFGKLNNREINLNNNINIIYGENEAGKSTLLKFILSMLYGISKNKNGNPISDLERYEPWDIKEYSGKIEYKLDDGSRYAVFRDFRLKNPEIYDSNLKEVSNKYMVDKTQGNMFFTEQVNVDSNLFSSIIVSKQDEVKLDSKMQSNLIQKMTNIVGTGDDNVSYNKTIAKLNKRLLEEVGTSKSKDRPINVMMQKKKLLEKEKKELVNISEEKYELEENTQQVQSELDYNLLRLDIAKKIKLLRDKEYFEKEKIKLNKNIDEDYNIEIENLEDKLQNINVEKRKSKMINPVLLYIVSVIIGIILKFVIPQFIIFVMIFAFLIFLSIIYTIKYFVAKKQINEEYSNLKYRNEEIKNQIKKIEKNKIEKSKNIQELEEKTNLELSNEKEKIKKMYKEDIEIVEINRLFACDNISEKIDEIQEQVNENRYYLNNLELKNKMLLPKIDKLVNIEEELKKIEEEYNYLIYMEKCIMLAKEMMTISYEEMKDNVTPKFTKDLSNTIAKISNNKYDKVKFDDQSGLMVELQNGKFVSAERLSIGTIDQLYLSLRLATINEVTNEKLPIILDETFAYYDSNRLKNILSYLNTEYYDRQVIIFTCTKREKEILDEEKISYNFIEL